MRILYVLKLNGSVERGRIGVPFVDVPGLCPVSVVTGVEVGLFLGSVTLNVGIFDWVSSLIFPRSGVEVQEAGRL